MRPTWKTSPKRQFRDGTAKSEATKNTFSCDSQIPILFPVYVGIFQNLVWKRELVDLPFQLVTRGLVRSMC